MEALQRLLNDMYQQVTSTEDELSGIASLMEQAKDEKERAQLMRAFAYHRGRWRSLTRVADAIEQIVKNTEDELEHEKARLRSYIEKEIARSQKGWSNPSKN
jgi:predicted  nucleic acid-binding Zn-ribbon protein